MTKPVLPLTRKQRIGNFIHSTVVVLLLIALVLLFRAGGCSRDEAPSAPSDPCEASYDRYVSNGSPNGLSESEYIDGCRALQRALNK